MKILEITVYGRPQQKGSKKAFIDPKTGHARLKDDNDKAMAWQDAIRAVAGDEYKGELIRGPVEVSATFMFVRPKNHYRTGKYADQLKANVPYFRISKPDTDKIVRTVLDGLKGIVYADDSQVQLGPCKKIYGERDAAIIRVETLY